MERIYLQKMYPGIIVSETSDVDITDTGMPEFVENGCYAYRLYKRTVSMVDGEELLGKKRDYSGTVFLGGRVYSLDEVKREKPNERILISNMEINDWEYVVETRQGQFVNYYPEKGDKTAPCMVCDEGVRINVFSIEDVFSLGEDIFQI